MGALGLGHLPVVILLSEEALEMVNTVDPVGVLLHVGLVVGLHVGVLVPVYTQEVLVQHDLAGFGGWYTSVLVWEVKLIFALSEADPGGALVHVRLGALVVGEVPSVVGVLIVTCHLPDVL